MEWIVIIVFISIVIWKLVTNEWKPSTQLVVPQTLCRSCVNVHSIKGTRGDELTFCNYGGQLRPVTFCVCECTGYYSKNVVPVSRIVGFVKIGVEGSREAFPATVIHMAAKTNQ